MHQFTTWTGTTVPLMNDNIDTDQLLPKQFLKLIDKKGFGKYLLYAWRYLDDNYTDNPDFILNQPEYQGASILITSEQVLLGNTLLGLWQIMASRSSLQAPLEIFITTMT